MFRLSFGFALALLSVACGPPTSGGGGGGGSQRGGTSCVVDTECSAGEVCQNGSCIERSGCRSDSDCGNSQMCTNNECVDASRSCDDIRDCAAGEICEDNQCQPQGASCTADRDCARGEVCSNGRCQRGDGTCGSDNDCPVGQSCRNGQCLTTGGGDECLRNRDCPAGQICENGSCIAEGSCTQDRDCNVGQACQNGQCVDVGGGACRTHAQCTAPQVCVVDAGQASGTCQSLVGRRCGGDSDCAFTDAQNATVSGTCESGRCKVRQFGSCTGDADCTSDLTCTTLPNQSRLCLKACRSNSVCDSQLTCEMQINRCWYNLCGGPDEVGPGFRASVNNGRLGGACNADGTNDGTCIEVEAGENDWVGLCIEGGTQAVGQSCLFETTRDDNANQCVGGATCYFDNDRRRGTCVSSCSAEGSRGSVRCSGATTCVAGRCLSAGQRCNPGTRDNCGPSGICAVANWEAEEGLCIVQEMNRVAIGGNCEDTAQCSDGSVCLALQAGQPKSCLGICRPAGGGAPCPNGTTCRSIPELSQNQVGGNWGLCVAPN